MVITPAALIYLPLANVHKILSKPEIVTGLWDIDTINHTMGKSNFAIG